MSEEATEESGGVETPVPRDLPVEQAHPGDDPQDVVDLWNGRDRDVPPDQGAADKHAPAERQREDGAA